MIYNAPSIYKNGGGGGGGYIDGGELIDADFIEVQNNSVSSYENTSRDPVNFYLDVSDGEVLNSSIEFTTSVNANINVYVVRNGLYYLLSYVNNTVIANKQYIITIIGNSYEVEEVNQTNQDPVCKDLDGVVYPVVNINGILWSASNLKANIPDTYNIRNSHIAGYSNEYYYRINQYQTIDNYLRGKGCRLPNYSDFDNLVSYAGGWNAAAGKKLRSTSNWYDNQGTNDYGFNAVPVSKNSGGEVINDISKCTWFLATDSFMQLYYDSLGRGTNMHLEEYISVRFVIDM